MKHFLLTAAAAAMVLALSSCAKTEVTDVPDSRYIGFDNAYIGNPTKAGLPQDEQYGSKKPISQFFVFGNTSVDDVVFDDIRVYESNGQWVYDVLKQWQSGATYKFAAYSTNENTPLDNVSFSYDDHKLTITDFVSDNSSQRDLLVATSSEDLNPDNVPVQFTFKHALAMIKFTLQSSLGDNNEITITEFKVTGINTKATLDVSESYGTTLSWGTASGNSTAFENTNASMTATTSDPAVSDEFVVIPQTITGNVTVTFKVAIEGVTQQPKELTATISNPDWKNGLRYNYVATITGTDVDVIEFSAPIIDDWDIYTDVPEDID